jgi:hypothetical protein
VDGTLLLWIAFMTVLVLGGILAAYFSWESYEKRRLQRERDRKDFMAIIEKLKKDPP